MSDTYNQASKIEVRERCLVHAVDILTTSRHKSPIVQLDELDQIVEFACDRFKYIGVSPSEISKAVRDEIMAWTDLYTARVAQKSPGDLKVLYLSGPEPLNDLSVMLECGVNPHNVWAIEGNSKNFNAAVADIEQSKLPLKIVNGNLAELFETFDESFDIIHFDACGPMFRHDTLSPLMKIASRQRLEPLSVLITNFSEPPQEHAESERYVRIMTEYFRYRTNDMPRQAYQDNLDPAVLEHDPRALLRSVSDAPLPYYSDFVSRFIHDTFRFWIPNCRALATTAFFNSHIASKNALKATLERALAPLTRNGPINGLTSDIHLAPASYPLYSFYLELKRHLPNDPLLTLLRETTVNGRRIDEYLAGASLLDRIIEGHWDCASAELIEAIGSSWFDQKSSLFCDKPLPNLLINALVGQYGKPLLPNVRKMKRFTYRAKTNRMFTDVILFDSCRYFYDWFPSLSSVRTRFDDMAFQVAARSMIDLVGRNDWGASCHPFRGSSVACFDEVPCALDHEVPEREEVTP
jgi:hypothetical protein